MVGKSEPLIPCGKARYSMLYLTHAGDFSQSRSHICILGTGSLRHTWTGTCGQPNSPSFNKMLIKMSELSSMHQAGNVHSSALPARSHNTIKQHSIPVFQQDYWLKFISLKINCFYTESLAVVVSGYHSPSYEGTLGTPSNKMGTNAECEMLSLLIYMTDKKINHPPRHLLGLSEPSRSNWPYF